MHLVLIDRGGVIDVRVTYGRYKQSNLAAGMLMCVQISRAGAIAAAIRSFEA